jgi:hypothetical protein
MTKRGLNVFFTAYGEAHVPPVEAVLSVGVLTIKGPRPTSLRLHNGNLSIDGVSIRSGAQQLGSVAAGCVTRIVFDSAPEPNRDEVERPAPARGNRPLTIWNGDVAEC